MLLQSQLNLYLHQFNCEDLGISLDLNIYSGFIHLNNLNKPEENTMSYEDSGFISLPQEIASESHDLSMLVK